ncbi:MAG: DUF262 domain-containing protein [Paludibacteraceae bacterium]|nr:DUF262 domain-containing protein [Paludibacteraceae bacterium]
MNDTYNFRSLLMEYQRISIPKIQRDYAQGRLTGKAPDVRENFLNDIFSGKVMSLDFIFGTAQECDNQKKFIPLDGQQRLTTLFLLYMYGIKTHILETNNLDLKKFTYETRKAARDFCHEIVTNEWPEISQGTAIRDAIVKQKWFMNYWLKDPTVEGMLTMLDAIHGKATKFNYPDLDNIKFRFFDMNEHNLSDNLYIKMNSRGKPLTAFENLKASIDKILPEKTGKLSSFDWLSDDEDLKKKTTFDEQWKHCIDRQWTDMFWGYKENYLSDPPFLRFIVNMLSAYWIGFNKIKQDDDGEKDKLLRFFLGITGNEDYISFDKFKDVLLSKTEKEENKSDNRLKTLVLLADGLNSFHKLLELDNLPEICRPSWEKNKEYDLVKNVLQLKGDRYNPSNKERAMFYALVKCPYISLIEKNKDETIAKIKHWMRVFWNIVEQEQERVRNFIGAVHLINELSLKIADDNCADIYEWLAKDSNVNGIKSGFMKDQVKEEIAKAKQIINGGDEWESKIIEAEKYAFFKGSIRFLFTDGDGKVTEDSWKQFDTKWDNAQKYFDDNGVKDKTPYKDDALLMKALLANCDNFGKNIWSRFEFSNDKVRWKRILTSDNWKIAVDAIMKEEVTKETTNSFVNTIEDPYIKNIVDDDLMNYVCNKMSGAWLRSTYHGYQAIWISGYPASQIVLNPILAQLKIDYRDINRIENCRYYKCVNKNVDFKYKFNGTDYFFNWKGNPSPTELDVYLTENNWNDYKKRPNPTADKGTEEDTHYCFRVTKEMEKDTSLFTKELDRIINEAIKK